MGNIERNALIIASLVALDQLSKAAFEATTPALDLGVFSLTRVVNTGASFGLLQGNNTLLVFISLIALGLVMANVKGITKKFEVPASLLTAGIIGNLIDRLSRGFVVDFIDLGWWPVFNIADSAIFIGVIWIAVLLVKEDNIIVTAPGLKRKHVKKNKIMQRKP
jgi:signal peptidase II